MSKCDIEVMLRSAIAQLWAAYEALGDLDKKQKAEVEKLRKDLAGVKDAHKWAQKERDVAQKRMIELEMQHRAYKRVSVTVHSAVIAGEDDRLLLDLLWHQLMAAGVIQIEKKNGTLPGVISTTVTVDAAVPKEGE